MKKLVKYWCPCSQCNSLIVAAVDGESIEIIEWFPCDDTRDHARLDEVEKKADRFIESLKKNATGYSDSILTPIEEIKVILFSMAQGAEAAWSNAKTTGLRSYHMGSLVTIRVILELIEKHMQKG